MPVAPDATIPDSTVLASRLDSGGIGATIASQLPGDLRAETALESGSTNSSPDQAEHGGFAAIFNRDNDGGWWSRRGFFGFFLGRQGFGFPGRFSGFGGFGGGGGNGAVNNGQVSSGGGNGGGAGIGSGSGGSGGPGGGGIFNEHRHGLPDLTGNGGGSFTNPGGGGGGIGPNVAANPEPSTIFLLGTGLIAAAGSVRRRLRSR
jgi:hypothetical protein